MITISEYFNVRQHIFMLHDFSHVTPPELGSSYEVMLTMLDRWASEHRRHSVEAWPRCAKLSCWYTIMSPCAQPCLALLLLARERGAVHVCGCFHLDYGNLDSLMKRSLQHYQSHTEELRTRKKVDWRGRSHEAQLHGARGGDTKEIQGGRMAIYAPLGGRKG